MPGKPVSLDYGRWIVIWWSGSKMGCDLILAVDFRSDGAGGFGRTGGGGLPPATLFCGGAGCSSPEMAIGVLRGPIWVVVWPMSTAPAWVVH